MDITEWYAVSLGTLVVLPIIARLFFSIIVIRVPWIFYLRRHLIYPQVHRYMRATRLELVALTAFLTGNALCLGINVRAVTDFVNRSGLIAIINLMPLALGADMNLIVSLCGIGLPAYAMLHRWLARVAITEALIHIAVATPYRKPNPHTVPDVAAIIVSVIVQQEQHKLTPAGRNHPFHNALLWASPLTRIRGLFNSSLAVCRSRHHRHLSPRRFSSDTETSRSVSACCADSTAVNFCPSAHTSAMEREAQQIAKPSVRLSINI